MERMTTHLEARKARGELKEETTEAQMTARKRMALLPVKHSEALFVQVRISAHLLLFSAQLNR